MVGNVVVSDYDLFGNRLDAKIRPRQTEFVPCPPPPQKAIYTGIRVHIRPSRLISLPQFSGGTMVRSVAQRAAEANLKQNKQNGKVSAKAKSKIIDAVNWLCLAAVKKRVYCKTSNKTYQFKINLLTLTLPDTSQEVSDSFFKEQLLQPFLSYMRKYYGKFNYVWKIEKQQNGKWHVHITSDTFIYHADLRRIWNNQLRRNGLLEDFKCKFGHDNPPTEQAKSVKSVKNMAAYMAKYLTKSEILGEQDVGRLWGCNYELSRANHFYCDAPAQYEHQLLPMQTMELLEHKAILGKMQANGFPRHIGDFYYVKATDWETVITGTMRHKFHEIISYLRTHIPPEEDSPKTLCLN